MTSRKQRYTPEQIDAAIKAVAKKHNGWCGQCARFAVSLNAVLGNRGRYVIFCGDHYEYADHIALKVGRKIFDADGLMSREGYRDWKGDGEVEYAEAGEEETVLRLVDDSSSWDGDLDKDRFEADLKKALEAAAQPPA